MEFLIQKAHISIFPMVYSWINESMKKKGLLEIYLWRIESVVQYVSGFENRPEIDKSLSPLDNGQWTMIQSVKWI